MSGQQWSAGAWSGADLGIAQLRQNWSNRGCQQRVDKSAAIETEQVRARDIEVDERPFVFDAVQTLRILFVREQTVQNARGVPGFVPI